MPEIPSGAGIHDILLLVHTLTLFYPNQNQPGDGTYAANDKAPSEMDIY